MIQIIDHGKWQLYTPEVLPPDAPPHAMFARRESDHVDWYEYSRDKNNFGVDTVKFTALWLDDRGGLVIGAATRDVSRIFPAGQLVRELTEFHGSDPQSELEVKRYDPEINRLIDPPPPEPPVLDPAIAALEARIAALEALVKGGTP